MGLNNNSELNSGTKSISGRPFKRRITLLIIILLIVALALTGVLYYRHHQNAQKAKSPTGKYSYTYQQLDGYSLKTSQTGTDSSFSKPVQFKAPANLQFSAGQAMFDQTAASNSPVIIGGLGSATVVSSPPGANYLSDLNQAVRTSNTNQYQGLITNLEQYVTARMDGYYVAFEKPIALVTPNIKSDAFGLNFTATPTTIGKTMDFQAMQGEAVLALSDHASYYFMIFSVPYNWQSNQAVWQQVIDSLKIDQ